MVPPPPSPQKPENSTSIKDAPYPKEPGKRRNHHLVQQEHPHFFPIGAIIMIKNRSMRRPIGPYKVVEHTKPLYHGGPPQYIVAPHTRNPAPGDWIQTNERSMFQYNAARVMEPLARDSGSSEEDEDDEVNEEF